jgi:anti-sigma regulatory factor (Ser/Thr protein kinase)
MWSPDEEPPSDEPAPLFGRRLAEREFADRVVLPAQSIVETATARDIGRLLPELVRAAGRASEISFIVGAFRELVDNALSHGAASPVGATATVICDHANETIELVVVDLGEGVPVTSLRDFANDLSNPRSRNLGGLPSLVESARLRGLRAAFVFVTKGRVIHGDGRNWQNHGAGVLPGFSAGIRVDWR